jgi:hypothetical protein
MKTEMACQLFDNYPTSDIIRITLLITKLLHAYGQIIQQIMNKIKSWLSLM